MCIRIYYKNKYKYYSIYKYTLSKKQINRGADTMTTLVLKNFYRMDNIAAIFYGSNRKQSKEEYQPFFELYEKTIGDIKRTLSKMHTSDPQYKVNLKYLVYLFKMVAYVRDQELGKGECDVSYIMVYIWYKYYPLFAIWLIHSFVGKNICGQYTRYGCWKDIKKICQYTLDMTGNENHSLIYSCIEIILQQFKCDTDILLGGNPKKYKHISLVAKWMPREKSKYGWLYEKIVFEWAVKYTPFMRHVRLDRPNDRRFLKATNKSRMIFRYLVSDLTQLLGVVEPILCNGDWNNIVMNHVNTCSLLKYKDAFLRKGTVKEYAILGEKSNYFLRFDLHNNILSSKKEKTASAYMVGKYKQGWLNNMKKCENTGFSSKIYNIPFSYFVKKAFEIIDKMEYKERKKTGHGNTDTKNSSDPFRFDLDDETELLNRQWNMYVKYCYHIECVFPIVDIRCVYDEYNMDYLYNSIGLACLIVDKSRFFGNSPINKMKRILVIRQNEPIWVDIPAELSFFETVKHLRHYMCGSTEYESNGHVSVLCAIDMFIESFLNTNMSLKNIEKMNIVIINDWKIEKLHEYNIHRKIKFAFESFFIQRKLSENIVDGVNAGAADGVHRDDFHLENIPHIIYWNISSKNSIILPANCRTKRVTMLSGCNHSMFAQLGFIGLKTVRDMTSYQFICNTLSSSRYDIMDTVFFNVLQRNSNMIIIDSSQYFNVCDVVI